jgi:hypothetical protein
MRPLMGDMNYVWGKNLIKKGHKTGTLSSFAFCGKKQHKKGFIRIILGP